MQFCMATDFGKLAPRLVTATQVYLYSIKAMHCQFTVYKLPGCSIAGLLLLFLLLKVLQPQVTIL